MRIAAIQVGVWEQEEEDQRWEQIERALADLERKQSGADLILLPEIWSCGFFHFDQYRDSAKKTEERMEGLGAWAKRLDAYIVTGSLVKEADGCFYNEARVLDRAGRILNIYRKIHLFGYESEEKKLLTPGTALCTAQTEFGTVGLATCYDLRFPEQFRAMAEAGACCFLIVSAWPSARLAHWRLFNQVRAVENQCFLFSCNCAGSQSGTDYAGHSMGIAPDGSILCEAGNTPDVILYDADLEQTERCRRTFPAWADRVRL